MDSFIRFKGGSTSANYKVKPYDENKWAATTDVSDEPIESSLLILDGLHSRWSTLLSSFTKEQMTIKIFHPENGKANTLGQFVLLYAWHC